MAVPCAQPQPHPTWAAPAQAEQTPGIQLNKHIPYPYIQARLPGPDVIDELGLQVENQKPRHEPVVASGLAGQGPQWDGGPGVDGACSRTLAGHDWGASVGEGKGAVFQVHALGQSGGCGQVPQDLAQTTTAQWSPLEGQSTSPSGPANAARYLLFLIGRHFLHPWHIEIHRCR